MYLMDRINHGTSENARRTEKFSGTLAMRNTENENLLSLTAPDNSRMYGKPEI
jgi:hypothetical protein